MPPEMVAKLQMQRKSTDVTVYPDCWDSVQVFLVMSTQWLATSRSLGMQYASLPVVFDMLEVPVAERKQVFTDIQTMEAAAIKVILERKQ